MAKLEFAILQYVESHGQPCKKCGVKGPALRVALRRDDKEVLERLQSRVQENLGKKDNKVVEAINKAFKGLISEFKAETIKII